MSTATVYVGAVSPESFAMDVTPGESGVDLSTVTEAVLYALKPSQEIASWTADLSEQTADALTVSYSFPGTSPVDEEGDWKVYALLTLPDGTVRTTSVTLRVLGRFQ